MAEMLLTWLHIDRWHVTELRDSPPFTSTAARHTEKIAWDEWLDGQEKHVLWKLQKKINYHSKKSAKWAMSAKVWQREPGTTSLSFIQAGKFFFFLINFDKNVAYNTILFFWIWIIIYYKRTKKKKKKKVFLHVAHIQSSQA